MRQNLRINGARLLSRLQRLAEEGARPDGGVCRLALSDADKAGRDLVVQWMRELGLAVTIDAIGNVVGVRRGEEDGAPVMMGSHIDTVATGGHYDGALGVLGGLEVIETLNDAGVVTKRPLAVAFFTNEEGARFQPDMFGSLVFTGAMPLEARAWPRSASTARSPARSSTRIGYRGDAPVGKPNVHAYVELHVEQGPTLEAEGLDDRRGRGRAGHLLDRIHPDRPVEPRRHDADADAPRRRLCRGGDRRLRAAARAGARRPSGRDRRRADADAQPRQRRRRARADDDRSAQHRQRAAQAGRAPPERLRRGDRGGGGRDARSPHARPLRSGRLRAASGGARRGDRQGIRSAGQAAAERRGARRADARRGLPGLHDLHAERRRRQPQHRRIHQARGPRRRRRRAAAAGRRSSPNDAPAHPRRDDRQRRRTHGAVSRRRPDRRRSHRRARRRERLAGGDRRPGRRRARPRARAGLRRHPQSRRARRHGARRRAAFPAPASSPFSAASPSASAASTACRRRPSPRRSARNMRRSSSRSTARSTANGRGARSPSSSPGIAAARSPTWGSISAIRRCAGW